MEKNKNKVNRENRRYRQMKVNVVYGEASLVECMKHVIREKYTLR